eukprot:UN00383
MRNMMRNAFIFTICSSHSLNTKPNFTEKLVRKKILEEVYGTWKTHFTNLMFRKPFVYKLKFVEFWI